MVYAQMTLKADLFCYQASRTTPEEGSTSKFIAFFDSLLDSRCNTRPSKEKEKYVYL